MLQFKRNSLKLAMQDVDEFVSSLEQNLRNLASLAHQCILCSKWVPSEWKSKQLTKTSQ